MTTNQEPPKRRRRCRDDYNQSFMKIDFSRVNMETLQKLLHFFDTDKTSVYKNKEEIALLTEKYFYDMKLPEEVDIVKKFLSAFESEEKELEEKQEEYETLLNQEMNKNKDSNCN
eukprot:GAHX01000213.1.p1 GENE.GAHX01000213.1~~GAHX01000213.1.p1  ORF type:complete len:115 (-),score=28.79 GAHX01000213.1:24-368(-)